MTIALPPVFRSHGFRILFTAQLVSVVGDFLIPVALAFAVLDATGSASDLGIVLLARIVPMATLVLAGGVWADRLPRRRLMITSHAVRFASQAALGVLVLGGHAAIWAFVLLQLVHGTASAFFGPASTGLTPQLVPRDQLQQANGLLFLTLSLGGIVGPAIAGVVVAAAGPGWAILGDAASFGVAALLLAQLQPIEQPVTARRPFLRELADGWKEVSSRTWLWASVVGFSVFQLVGLASLSVLGPLVAKRSLGGASAWALILVAFGIGAAVGNGLAVRVRPRRPLATAYLAMLLTAPSLLLLAVAAPVLAIGATEFASGAAIGLGSALWETTLQREVPPQVLSRVAAYDVMGSIALRPIGLAIAGPVAAAAGVRPTLVGAFLLTVGAMLALLAVPDVWRISGLEAPERPVEDVPA